MECPNCGFDMDNDPLRELFNYCNGHIKTAEKNINSAKERNRSEKRIKEMERHKVKWERWQNAITEAIKIRDSKIHNLQQS